MTRRRRWIVAILLTFIVALLAFGSLGYWLLLPWLVRQQITAAFRAMGFETASFQLRASSVYQTDVANLSAGESNLLSIAEIDVHYSPLRALRGDIDSITLRNLRLTVDLDHPPRMSSNTSSASSAGVAIPLPFEKLELVSSTIVLKRGNREIAVPVAGSAVRAAEGTITTLSLIGSLGGSPLKVLGTIDRANGNIQFTANTAGTELEALAPFLPPRVTHAIDRLTGTLTADGTYSRSPDVQSATLRLALRDGSIHLTEELDAEASHVAASIDFDELLMLRTAPGQQIMVPQLSASGATITNLLLRFQFKGLNEVAIEELQAEFAGGIVRAAPFTFDPSNPSISTTISVENVGVAETVALLTDRKGTGSGAFSGSVSIAVDFSKAVSGNAVTVGKGAFVARPGGNLHLGEATAGFEDMLERSNPAFGEPEMADIRQSIVDAVRDFDYDLLDLKFAQQNGEDVVSLRLHGRGRTGERVPINLGVNLQGGAKLLNNYLALKSRVFTSGTKKAQP